MIREVIITYTGILAEQLINGTTMIVINLSFEEEIVRADIIAGTAHAAPPNNGIIDLPFNPNRLKNLSIIKETLAIYPVSSKKAMKENRNAI